MKRGYPEEPAEEVLCNAVADACLEQEESDSPVANAAEIQEKHLKFYDQMLPFAERCNESLLDWKAWANCGACLYQLNEKKASWDSYEKAVTARGGFKAELTDAELMADPQVGKFLRQLNKEFCTGGWGTSRQEDMLLFSVLVQKGRACEIATKRWHEILPNHYYAVTQALCRKLGTPKELLHQVCPDDSRMEFQQGNRLALLASPTGLFGDTGNGKRAKLQPDVRDVCVEVQSTAEEGQLDFDVVEVAQPND
eukprot:TRINITY_DN10545_c0_g3_i1.p1 TRINITY_DN10545_c0_g3~~TRINITY_DN10545_c0_g3_i1.p1  ORF type:complete len:253 (-),score=59.79 TRINITY_DN10545_c0_g3_i1:355-1113(-)